MTKTIIYVSSNRENPEFEKRIRETLLKNCGDIPIISVTQKPVDLGKNICVGDVGASGFNFCSQILIGCKAANSDFIISAESDCLYPSDYFEFNPDRLDIPYRNTNIYVQRRNQDFVYKKQSSTFSQIVGREFYIERLIELFSTPIEKDGHLVSLPVWDKDMKNFPKEINEVLFHDFEFWESKNPCISFKTGKGMRNWSAAGSKEIYELPYWGSVKELRKHYGID